MKLEIPTDNHLNRMYFELSRIGAPSVGSKEKWPYGDIKTKEELIALACDMSRFDPRLLDVIVLYFANRWSELNPSVLRSHYKDMRTPQTLAVVLEFLKEVVTDEECTFFAEYLSKNLKAVSYQFYFFDLYAPGSILAKRAVEEGLYEFKKWGFFASERPVVDLASKKSVGLFDAASRKNILQRMLKEKGSVSLGDYLKAIHGSISRQQALADIKSSGLAEQLGKGRSAKWTFAA